MTKDKENTSTPVRSWHHLDAKSRVLGRLATEAVTLLRGKNKATFRRHTDSGDMVVITNARHVVLTGNKETGKFYYSHSGYPGGFKSITAAKLRETKPEELVIKAITGMLPKTHQRDIWLKRLKVYADAEHPHAANIETKNSKPETDKAS